MDAPSRLFLTVEPEKLSRPVEPVERFARVEPRRRTARRDRNAGHIAARQEQLGFDAEHDLETSAPRVGKKPRELVGVVHYASLSQDMVRRKEGAVKQ